MNSTHEKEFYLPEEDIFGQADLTVKNEYNNLLDPSQYELVDEISDSMIAGGEGTETAPAQSDAIDEIPEDVLTEDYAWGVEIDQPDTMEEIPEDVASEDEGVETGAERIDAMDKIPEDVTAEDGGFGTAPEQSGAKDEIPEDVVVEDEDSEIGAEQSDAIDEIPEDVAVENDGSEADPAQSDTLDEIPEDVTIENDISETELEQAEVGQGLPWEENTDDIALDMQPELGESPYSYHFPGYEAHEFPEVDNPKVLNPEYQQTINRPDIADFTENPDNVEISNTANSIGDLQAKVEPIIDDISSNNQLSTEDKIEALNALKDQLQELNKPTVPVDSDTNLPTVQSKEFSDIRDVSDWIGDINPNFDPFDINSPYCNNCGSCAYAVYQRLEGNPDSIATSENIGFNSEMEALTGMEQVSMSPEEIQNALLEQGDGAHAIIGIDRADSYGHWFNAACINGKVVAIDGQTGEVMDWPPDYGDVVNWEMSVKKENQ